MGLKQVNRLIDSRHLKILAAKKSDLKDALVLIILDESKYGRADKMAIRQVAKQIESIEPDAAYFPVTKDMNVQIYDRAEFKNRDIVVTLKHDQNAPYEQIEAEISRAFADARSISFVHGDVAIERK